ncbi:MAG: GDSL-type esterase/lipase family protein [Chthoniobacteraceae bacterium]
MAVALISTASVLHAEIAVKSGEKIAFLGDSITQGGWSNPAGYVNLVIAGLAANGVNATPIPAGISGHKSNQMLERLDRDVLSKKPNWMTLSCGVNDVWHGKFGVPLDDTQAASQTYEKRGTEPDKGTYKRNITQIVEKAQAAGVQPVLLTATVIKEDLNSPENKALAPYNNFLRQLAKEKKLRLADLNTTFHERIKAANTPGKNAFTGDGVHMNGEGNKIMALGVLKAFGLDEAQLKKAQGSWPALEAKAAEAAKAAAAKKIADEEKKAAEARAAESGQASVPAAK